MNWHACDQLDHTVECVATRWPYKLSDHRPVIFARRGAQKSLSCEGVSRALPAWTLEHESWAPEVKEMHLDLLLQHGSDSSHNDLIF